MTIEQRLAALEHLYAVYDRYCESIDGLACRKFCADCCSRHVTMTTLEGLYLLDRLDPVLLEDCLTAISRDAGENAFQPRWTTNQIAALCREGQDPPEDDVIHDDSHCPLLEDSACSFYALRPFGCRCMLSRYPCGSRGYADVDGWVLTVNTVFLQTIEHIDRPGCFGNMLDVLQALSVVGRQAAYRKGRSPLDAPGLIPNQPAPMLMIPPEHRERIQPILEAMQQGVAG